MNQFTSRQDLTCTEVQNILEAYLTGEFDADTHATIAAHVASCPRCQDEVRFAEIISEALQELPRPEPPPKIFDEVSAYVRAHSDGNRKWTHRIFQLFAFWGNLPSLLVRASVLACLVGSVLFGIYQYQHHTRIAQASRDLNYALSKLHYAMKRTDIVVNEKLPDMRIDEASRRSFVMIEEASRRVSKQKMNISSVIHKSLDSFNRLPQIIPDTKHQEHSHQKGDTS